MQQPSAGVRNDEWIPIGKIDLIAKIAKCPAGLLQRQAQTVTQRECGGRAWLKGLRQIDGESLTAERVIRNRAAVLIQLGQGEAIRPEIGFNREHNVGKSLTRSIDVLNVLINRNALAGIIQHDVEGICRPRA